MATRDLSASASVARARNTIDERILNAAVEVLAEVGPEGVSMRMIARRADVSAPTLYRRWASKNELIGAAIRGRAPRSPASGSPLMDATKPEAHTTGAAGRELSNEVTLPAWVTVHEPSLGQNRDVDLCTRVADALADIVSSPESRAYTAVMNSAQYRRDLDGHVRGAFFGRKLAATREMLDHAVARRDIGPQVSVDLLLDMLIGTAEYQCREVGRFDRAFVRRIICDLWGSEMMRSVLARPAVPDAKSARPSRWPRKLTQLRLANEDSRA